MVMNYLSSTVFMDFEAEFAFQYCNFSLHWYVGFLCSNFRVFKFCHGFILFFGFIYCDPLIVCSCSRFCVFNFSFGLGFMF